MASRTLLLFYTLYFVGHSASFKIEEVLAQVTMNQVIAVVWTHEQGDPTSFGLVVATSPFSFQSTIPTGSAEATPQQTGRMIFKLPNDEEKPLYLAAWDTRSQSLEAKMRASDRPFFKGPTPITVGAVVPRTLTSISTEIVFATPTSSSVPITTSSDSNVVKTRIIAGSVVGCLAAILFTSLGLWYWRRTHARGTKRSPWQLLD
ncbi:hypothetical protein AAF712_002542 [Marasmius tenuissimus]|uniref:Uncharacterized protein n=1 Tax=Marasmius tenuissimus TaxID=585030 RepID=A0ABR3AAJ1_9AGAR